MSNKHKNKSLENSRNSQQPEQNPSSRQEVPDNHPKSQAQQPKMQNKDCRG